MLMSEGNKELDVTETLPSTTNMWRMLTELTETVLRLTIRIESLEANMAIARSGQPSLPWVDK